MLTLDHLLDKFDKLESGNYEPFPDLNPYDWDVDPIERITKEPQLVRAGATAPAPVFPGMGGDEIPSVAGGQLRAELQHVIPEPFGGQERAELQHLVPEPKFESWFEKFGGGPSGDFSGFIPEKALAPVGGGHMLRPDAAKAYKAMRRAMRNDGLTLAITDSYRDYAAQVELKKRKPTLAATPGHSQHGWGLAVDANVNDPKVLAWLREHGEEYGFKETVPGEEWHWEYQGGYAPAYEPAKGARQQRRTRPKRDPTRAPADVISVRDPLVTIPMTFGSALGEMRRGGRATTKRDYERVRGLGFVPAKYRKLFIEAAEKYGIDPRLLGFVAKHESGFNPKAVSPLATDPAKGLMQIRAEMHGLKNPFNPRANVMKGAALLAGYIEEMGSLRKGLASYNAGMGNWEAGLDYADSILQEFLGRAA